MRPQPQFLLLPHLLLLLFGAAAATQERRVDDAPCGRTLLTGRTGLLKSHARYARRPYPAGLSCTWHILAPPRHRLLLFPAAMALESDAGCKHDRLEVFDGLVTSGPARRSLGALCGSDRNALFLSSGSFLTVRLTADATHSKDGFLLRFLRVGAGIRPRGAARLTRAGRECRADEFRCRSGLCTPRGALCDRIDDCGDDSDERLCAGAPPPSACGPTKIPCGPGSCKSGLLRCDGLIDCPDATDELHCGPGGILAPPPPNTSSILDSGVTTRMTCGKALVSPKEVGGRVVGGSVARRGAWPWAVSLRLWGGHSCGGSILNRYWILTAAHCMDGEPTPSSWKVVAGLQRETITSGRGIQKRSVSRIRINPRWDPGTIDYDTALIRLSRPLSWTGYVRPICLPARAAPRGTACYIAGWGDTKGTGGAGYLKQGLVRTFSHAKCDYWYGGGITGRMQCAGREEGGVDTCQGDSGGPLMCEKNGKYELQGVTSFGAECGAPRSPGVYAKVAAMRTWVRQVTGL